MQGTAMGTAFAPTYANLVQMQGTAMGTTFAPTYATLVLGYLEIKLYNKTEETFSNEIGLKFQKVYRVSVWVRKEHLQ